MTRLVDCAGLRWPGDALLDASNKANQRAFVNEWRRKLDPILAVASIHRDQQQTCTAFDDVLDSAHLQLYVQPLRQEQQLRAQDDSREVPTVAALASSMPPRAVECLFLFPIEVELSVN